MLHNRISVTRMRERKGSRKPNRKPPPRGEARNCKKDSNFARFSLLFNCAKKQAELKLIGNFLRRNPSEGLVVLWVKLKRRGYAQSLSSLYRVMQREGYFAERSKKKPKYIPKPYTQMTYP